METRMTAAQSSSKIDRSCGLESANIVLGVISILAAIRGSPTINWGIELRNQRKTTCNVLMKSDKTRRRRRHFLNWPLYSEVAAADCGLGQRRSAIRRTAT